MSGNWVSRSSAADIIRPDALVSPDCPRTSPDNLSGFMVASPVVMLSNCVNTAPPELGIVAPAGTNSEDLSYSPIDCLQWECAVPHQETLPWIRFRCFQQSSHKRRTTIILCPGLTTSTPTGTSSSSQPQPAHHMRRFIFTVPFQTRP